MTRGRIINALFWLYLWLSEALMPVVNAGNDFWSLKMRQLVTFGPFDDLPRFFGRAFFPLILWAVIDWRLRRAAAAKAKKSAAQFRGAGVIPGRASR